MGVQKSKLNPQPDHLPGHAARLIPGMIFILICMAGLEFAAVASAGLTLADRSSIATLRPSVTRSAGIESATGLGWTAATLLLVMVVVRRPVGVGRAVYRLAFSNSLVSVRPAFTHRRAFALSFQAGGLYGP